MNFWDQEHPLSTKYNTLFEELVPVMGKSDTLQGELIRAVSKINYDWFNNGWGCNNWSGAVVFLQDNINFLTQNRGEVESKEFIDALRNVKYFSHGERVTISDERADELVTVIAAFVVQSVIDNPLPIDNEVDMLDLGEPDAPYEEEDEEYFDDYEDGYEDDSEDEYHLNQEC